MMKRNTLAIIIGLLLLFLARTTFAQQPLVSDAKKKELNDFAGQLNNLYSTGHKKALTLAQSYSWPIRLQRKNGGIVSLQSVNSLGFPVYLITHNLTSAQTTNTTAVWPGGPSGLSLSGSSTFLNDKMAIWDGGSVYTGHQEFTDKTITVKDDTPAVDHATHVAGTMIAQGVYTQAKGMAFNAATLISYDFDNDVAKMGNAAAGLLLSNHSYGDEAGWDQNNDGTWTWYGLPGDTVDYTFGFYDARAQAWDQIAYDAPYYLIVESAGNAHAYPGPAVGTDYYGYKSVTDQTIVNKGPRPANISSNTGYQVISTTGNAKNILTVGAVNPLISGPSNSQDVVIAYFSSYGPTNDGRVKPDITGMGVDVLSTGSSGPQSYLTMSGTSMSCPNVTGSLYLLQEYYAQLNGGKFMRAATLKGLACGTAFDAGNLGPDYIYGWGLLNMTKAAQAMADNGTKSLVTETTLQQAQIQKFSVVASGIEPLIATISWTDPPATPTADGVIDDPTPKLINDLDLRVSDGITLFKPWILDPTHPSAPATTGDNIRDNIEQVYIQGAIAGKTYALTVSNKGSLQSGSQDYSLIVTGTQAILPPPDSSANISLSVYPVPASSQLNVSFNTSTSNALNLALVNSAGQIVYTNNRNLNAGNFDITIDVASQSPGVYVVKMLLGQKLYSRKILIGR